MSDPTIPSDDSTAQDATDDGDTHRSVRAREGPHEGRQTDTGDGLTRRDMLGKAGTVGTVVSTSGIGAGLMVGTATAQEAETFSDYFEDQTADGWDGQNMTVVENGIVGNWSLESQDNLDDQADNPEWVDGPVLDLSEEFTVRGVSNIDQGDGTARSGFGIVRSVEGSAEGIILTFSAEFGATFIAETAGENPNIGGEDELDHYANDFNTVWVHWELFSTGDGTIQAKVWPDGDSEPEDYEISRDMEPDFGEFSVFMGTADIGRVNLLDEVEITGQQSESEFLTLEVPPWLERGQTADYQVIWKTEETGEREDVTDSATVTSSDPDVVSVDEAAHTVTATEDDSVNDRVTLTATYAEADEPALANVTVADVTAENIDVLPPWRRVQASLGNPNIGAILAAIMAGVIGAQTASAFAGLGFATILTVIAWAAGFIDIGIAMVGLFLSLFIGLNMAANIDYTVRR